MSKSYSITRDEQEFESIEQLADRTSGTNGSPPKSFQNERHRLRKILLIRKSSVICQINFRVFSGFLGFLGFRKPGNLETSKLVTITMG